MSECRFCSAMEQNREFYAIAKSWTTEEEKSQFGEYMIEYSVAIVKRSWYKKNGKRSSSRTTDYRNRGLGYALNYCPECGKRMIKRKGNKMSEVNEI